MVAKNREPPDGRPIPGEFTPQRLSRRVARNALDHDDLPWGTNAKSLPAMCQQLGSGAVSPAVREHDGGHGRET
jgi:hypothetical protein